MNRIDTILRHIQEDCQDIQAFTDGLDERSFLENKLVRNAVGMSLINIGELVKSLPMDFRETNPQIPWLRIAGMRDMAAHKYQTLDMVAVWNVTQNRIPEILAFIETYFSDD